MSDLDDKWAAQVARSVRANIAPARVDNRPLFYDVPHDPRTPCAICEQIGLLGVKHKKGAMVMNDPSNPPPGADLNEIHTICIRHLPANAVIFNPHTSEIRDKKGNKL